MKKFLFTLFISVFILVSCKGAFSYLEEPETKLITVTFNNGNERFASFYNNLRYEVTVCDEKNNFYKEYKERDVMTREEYIASYEREFGTITEKEREELLSLYDTYFSEELKYYTYPEMFNIVLPEGTYTFKMEAYGMSDFNKNVLLLQGETTADIKELSEEQNRDPDSCSISIKLNEVSVPASITTGGAICSYYGSGTFDGTYYFRYTTASDFEENGNEANWKNSTDSKINNIELSLISNSENNTNIKVTVNDLPEGSYCFQMVFDFPYKDADGKTEEYFSYSTELADIKPGFVTNVFFDFCSITQFGEATFVYNKAEKKSVKYLYGSQYTITIPTLNGFTFKGWSEEPDSTEESKKIMYAVGILQYENGARWTYYKNYDTYADVLSSPDFNPESSSVQCYLNSYDNPCTGNFTLYAIWEEEQLPEFGMIQDCKVFIPNETYSSIEFGIQYADVDGTYDSITQNHSASFFINEETYYEGKNLYISSIDNIQLKKTENFELIIKITLYDTDDFATVLFASVPINNDGTIVGQIIDLSNERINHKPTVTTGYIKDCTIQLPYGEISEEYRSFDMVLHYNDVYSSIKTVSKNDTGWALSENTVTINEILLDVAEGNELRVDFHITDKDGKITDICDKYFEIRDGQITMQEINLQSETIKHKAYIRNCILVFPDGEDISTYGADFRIELIYEDNETQPISSGEYTINSNIIDIREVEIKDNTISRITLKFYNIKGRYDYSTTLNMGYGGGLQDTNISIEDDFIFRTPGTYTINSTVQDLIYNNSTPSSGCVYSLSTENELQQIGTWTKSGLSKGVTYVLYDNIEITTTSNSSIIGSGTNYPFEGIFDGNGNSITYNVSASSSPASLFDAVGSMDASVTAMIKNLTVYGSVSSSKDTGVIGGIVGIAFGNVIIDNCVSEVSVSGSKSSAVGGICGRVQNIATSCNVQIYNCINKGKVEGQNRVGGIIGDVADSTEIFNCANIGQISFSGDTGGGLIGAVDTRDSISKLKLLQNCYNMGEVSYTGTGTRAGDDYYLGGIIGGESSSNELNFDLLISNVSECYWKSTLTDSAVASSTDDIEGLYLITDVSSLNELLNSGISRLGENKTSCKNWKLVDIIEDGSSKTYPLF